MSGLTELVPDLVADVRFYPASEGGPTQPVRANLRCDCAVTNHNPGMMHTAELLLGTEPMDSGDSRRTGFVFLTNEGADAMRKTGTFYLWKGRFFGEATIVPGLG